MTAMLVGTAVFLILTGMRPEPISDVVGRYVGSAGARRRSAVRVPSDGVVHWGGVGMVIGALMLPLSWPVGAVVGATAAITVRAIIDRRLHARRRRSLGYELPAIADLMALYVLSGESVLGAIRSVHAEAAGVAADELGSLLESVDSGRGLPEAVVEAARDSAHPDGARLYEMLAYAHRSGSRLVDALEMFAADRRSAIAGEMTEEGGRRALIGYGPILGLMIPTTLAFLIYPTLAGLDALAASQ